MTRFSSSSRRSIRARMTPWTLSGMLTFWSGRASAHRRFVRPMEVLEEQHQRRLGGEGGEIAARDQEDLTPDRVGLELAHAFAKLSGDLETEEAREVREDRINVLAEQGADPLLDL